MKNVIKFLKKINHKKNKKKITYQNVHACADEREKK